MVRRVRVRDQRIISTSISNDPQLKWSLYGPLSAGQSGRDSHPYGGYLQYVYAHLTSASSTGDVTIDVSLNDVVLGEIVIPATEHFGEVTFLEGFKVDGVTDYVDVTITSAGTGSARLTVFGSFS